MKFTIINLLLVYTNLFTTAIFCQTLEKIPSTTIDLWRASGVEKGILTLPTVFNSTNAITVINYSSKGINDAIEKADQQKKTWVFLPNGEYELTTSIKMKSTISLVGESKEGVKCYNQLKTGSTFSFFKNENSGIYNISIIGKFPYEEAGETKYHTKPKYNWNLGISENYELVDNTNNSVFIKTSKNCWVKNVLIKNSGLHPIRISGDSNHCTIQKTEVDGVFNKSGGAQGYFFILGAHNLIIECKVTHLRHFSIQGSQAEFNVVYNNDFLQEVSFHSGDGGNNLIENNRITLPTNMPPANGRGGPPYYAIMGTWSTQHINSLKDNFLFNNRCVQNNRGGALLFESQNKNVFSGPILSKKEAENKGVEYDHTKNFEIKYELPRMGLYANSKTLSIENTITKNDDIQIFPNPISNELHIKHKGIINGDFQIYDLKGSLVLSKKNINSFEGTFSLNVISSLRKGIYVFIMNNDSQQIVKKIIKL